VTGRRLLGNNRGVEERQEVLNSSD
jgi:hypothetical protein